MICRKGLERRLGKITQFTKDSTAKDISMVTVFMYGVMVLHMTVNGSGAKYMGKEPTLGQMEGSILANGRKTRCMDLVK